MSDEDNTDHVEVDYVFMVHVRAEEPSIYTLFENVNDKSFYDLDNFSNKILSNNEKRQILDIGSLQPSGTIKKDILQNDRFFLKPRATFKIPNRD
ncbi:zinc finger MYM-type protein 1 [Trichonephila clavipes]|nr:zinc finger MYM-type protein 1 [Trichonephila clavipes]